MRYLVVALTLITLVCSLQAQYELRIEDTGMPPVLGPIRAHMGKVYYWSHQGMYVFEPQNQRWRHLGYDSRQFDYHGWTVSQPDGYVVSHSGSNTSTFNTQTERVDYYPDIRFSVRLSDSIVGYVENEEEYNSQFRIRMSWLQWPSLDTIKVDSVGIGTKISQAAIQCVDSTTIVLARSGVCRFRFDSAPEYVPFLNIELTGWTAVYSDRNRTAILLRTMTGECIYSKDGFKTYAIIRGIPSVNEGNVRLSSDTNLIYVEHSGVIQTVNIKTMERNILFQGPLPPFSNYDVVNDSLFVALEDTVLLLHNGTSRVINEGLPCGPLYNVRYFKGGIVGTSQNGIRMHTSGGKWERMLHDSDVASVAPYGLFPMGGNSLEDCWFLANRRMVHIRNYSTVEKYQDQVRNFPERGFHTKSGGNSFIGIEERYQQCGQSQIVELVNGEPTRVYLCKRDVIKGMMVFEDSIYVAYTENGIAWRTTNIESGEWQPLTFPQLPLNTTLRTRVNGPHGLAWWYQHMWWTHDAGATWQYVENIDGDYTATITADGSIFVARYGDILGALIVDSLIIERRIDTVVTVVTILDVSKIVNIPWYLGEIAYDEVEQRLYIGAIDWTGSIQLPTTSVDESDSSLLRGNHITMRPGYYDLMGRFVAEHQEDVPASGVYFLVDKQSVKV
ncbi:MAG: hypothetical protein IPI24_13345 [Ignavibacteria bacterium]|nr:hypothetical protein [Ignavibacteria bacterium]